MNKKETPRDSDQKRESLSKPLEVDAENGQPEEKTSTSKIIFVLGMIVLTIVCLIILWKYILKSPNLLNKFIDFCEGLANQNIQNWLLSVLVVCLCQFFFFPGQSTFIAVSSYFIGHYLPAMIRFVSILWPIKLCGFLLVKHCIYHRVHMRFKNNDIYKAIEGESRINGWTTSFLCNFMWIMSSLKMYLIPLLSITVYQFVLFMLVGEIVYSSLFVLIGIQVKDIHMFIKGDMQNMSGAQKLSSFGFLAFTLTTVIMILIILYKVGARINEIKEKYNQQLESEGLLDKFKYEGVTNRDIDVEDKVREG